MKSWSGYSRAFGQPVVEATIKEVGVYAEDQWKARNRLTVTLGGRYEHSYAPQPPITNPDWPQTGQIHTGTLDLSPRLGISYRINDKTVLRGGYGTFFARFLGSLVDNFWTTNGLYQISDSLSSTNKTQIAAGPVFPNAFAAPPTGATVGASTIQFGSPTLKTPSGSPIGSFTTPVDVGLRPNTKYGGVYEVTNGVSSYYDGLTLTFEKRFSHGFQSLASYTWSHEIDDGQGAATNALFFNSLSPFTYNGNYAFEKGSGLLDQRHRFVYSFVWNLPRSHQDSFFVKYVVNNWQLASITTLAAGRPTGSLTVRMTDTPVVGMLSNSTLNGLGGNSRVPFEPVDSLYTPPTFRDDMRLTKIIPLLNERLNLALMFEAFNISNTWSPTALTTQQYTETKGVLTPTPSAYGVGSADGGFPDGTQARRLQISARITF